MTSLLTGLAAYIPRDRVAHIVADGKRPFPTNGVAMIADISGFTPLTEALTAGLSAGHGAEELTRALDSVFTPLIQQIHAYHGSVIKFGGDALIVWFGEEFELELEGSQSLTTNPQSQVILRALTAARKMQQVMADFGQIPTPIGPVVLKMKIGLAYGPVKRFNLGLPEYGCEDIIAGAVLDRMAEAEHHAEPGDIITDKATWAAVSAIAAVTDWRDDFGVIGALTQSAPTMPWPELAWRPEQEEAIVKALADYVPRPIYDMLVAKQAHVAELKPVVSLFVQFHGLDYDDDPDIAAKLQTYFVTAQRVVARYNGRLNRLITGDKGSLLHIIFGAPRSVEEQEMRAVRCALDLQAECGQLPFITMQRIGVTSGRVFAGPVGSPRRHDYTTMGDAINLSARLMQNAADDQILLDTAVRQQLSAAIQVTDLGFISVKGKAEPIHIYTATAYQPPERPLRRTERLFGREAELAVIRKPLFVNREPIKDDGLQNTDNGRVVVIIGEVGQGKTLLLDNVRLETETVWQSARDGGIWASGISLAYGNSITGYLFIELLRDLLNVPPAATPHQTSQRLRDFCEELFGPARLESSYPYLAKFMNLPLPADAAARLEGLAGESLRWQLFELIPELLRLLCQQYPLVLVLDDLQWADPTSLQLVERLVPLTAELPLLLLLAMRPETETRAWTMVQAWDAARLPITRLTLSPLDDNAATALIAFHVPDLPKRVVAYLVTKGGGNPLFLVELVRTLQITAVTDMAHIELDALDLPNSVQGLLLAQLDRLAVETRHTLQLAAVIGKSFLDQVLVSISTAEQQVTNLLTELEGADYIRPNLADLGDAHTFRHALIQEGAYSTLLHERRRTYHRQVAEAFEQLFPAAIAEQAAFLAFQYEQAENVDKAIYYYLEIADRSRLLYAHDEADILYRRVLSLMETQANPDPQRRAKTYLKMAQVRANESDFTGAQDFYELAFALMAQQTEVKQDEIQTDQPLFRWGILPEYAQNFDPGLVEGLEILQIVVNLFEGLVEVDNEWNVIPALARRWEVLDDGKRYLFHLRSDSKWSDGTPVTSHDFVFAWRRNLHQSIEAPEAYQLFAVAGAENFYTGKSNDPALLGIRAIDDLTLEIRLETPITYFLYLLAHPIAFPQPAHFVKRLGSNWAIPENLIGNGPYKVSIIASNEPLHLVRNAFYHRYFPGNLAEVAISFTEPTLANYSQGNIDWCRIDDQPDISKQLGHETYLVQAFVTFIIGFACNRPPFDNKWVRRAFAQCIDRHTLVQQVWNGVQQPANGGLIPPGMPGHSPEIGIGFDPVQARHLLNQTGYKTGKEFGSIRLDAFPGFGQTPFFLQDSWQKHLDIAVNVMENVPVEQALANLTEGKSQILLTGFYAEYPDPDDILRSDFHRDSSSNLYGWRNSQFDELIDQAAKMTTSDTRFSIYHQADQLLIRDEAAVVPLYYLQANGLLRPKFTLSGVDRILRGNYIKFKNIEVNS